MAAHTISEADLRASYSVEEVVAAAHSIKGTPLNMTVFDEIEESTTSREDNRDHEHHDHRHH